MDNLTYISFGAGVQSTALLVCSDRGLCGVPKADVAIFADTQCEPAWVYRQVEAMRRSVTIPIETVVGGDLLADIRSGAGRRLGFNPLPVWVQGPDGRAAPGMRQCTSNYKIRPIERAVRRLMGYRPRQRIKHKARAMIGISLDEFERAKPSRVSWIENLFPLLDANLTRNDCRRVVAEAGLEPAFRSACVVCPFHSDDYWRALRDKFPEEWSKAVSFDEEMRTRGSGLRRVPYLHRSLRPLAEVRLDSNQGEFSWANECGGTCGL